MIADVAVVIPVRDGAPTIGATVDAVRRQTLAPAEIVVVDNGSTDDTAAIARAAGARVVHEERPGSYAARNAGIAATDADIVAFTDADCVPDVYWLEQLAAGFRDGVDVVGGIVVAMRVGTAAERWCRDRHVLDQARSFGRPAYLPFFATANVAWRREAIERIGGFDADLASGGDVDACWRLQHAGGTLGFAPDAVVHHPYRSGVRALLAQQRRYAEGHGRLDARWGHDPRYRAAAGTTAARTRALWLTPLRVPWRLLTGGDVAIPLLDAAVRAGHEVARRRGRRRPLPTDRVGRPAATSPR